MDEPGLDGAPDDDAAQGGDGEEEKHLDGPVVASGFEDEEAVRDIAEGVGGEEGDAVAEEGVQSPSVLGCRGDRDAANGMEEPDDGIGSRQAEVDF